ncbi:MAG: hemolysin family protein [Planctomycetes bacterium]|nr:hemolysin family protein [Planctomycetota bacterium]
MSMLLPTLADVDFNWVGITFSAVLVFVLLVLSGVFSGSETILFSLTPAQLQHHATSRNPFRRLAVNLMAKPQHTLMTILIGNTGVNVLLFATWYVLFQRLSEQVGPWVTPVAGATSVLLVVVCGEVVPKIVGVSLADRLAPYSAAAVHVSGYVLGPLGRLTNFILVEPLTRLLSGRPSAALAAESELSTDEIRTLLEMSRRRGLIDPTEDSFLREVVKLSSLHVRDVMIPRVEVQAYDVNASPQGLRELMRATCLKKIPVYDGDMDNLVGLIYAKVLFLEPDQPLSRIIMPVRFVPEIITCEQLLHHFRNTRSQLAMAVDEFGGVAGLVTLEDVLEEIVGEIHDPDDTPVAPEVIPLSDTVYDISGQLSVHYWAEMFDLPRLTERVATVGGLITARLGRPAQVGDRALIGNVQLTVTETQRRRVERVRLSLLSGPGADD